MSKDETATVLQSQFKENTGQALCDSGGSPKYDSDGKYIGSDSGYGRGYERLRGRDMDAEPKHSLRISKYGIEYSKSAYHALLDILDFSPDMDALWRAFDGLCDACEGLDNQWMRDNHDEYDRNKAEALAEIVKQHPDADTDAILSLCDTHRDDYQLRRMEVFPKFLGLLGRDVVDNDACTAYNSYNGESTWNSVIQFMAFVCDGTAYVLLQTHNGADVRGGYSEPRCYEGDTDYLHLTADGYIVCENDSEHSWSTDDAYHWYFQGTCGVGAGTQLEKYEIVEASEIDGVKPLLEVLDKGEDDLKKLCELSPDKAEALRAQHEAGVAKIRDKIAEKIGTCRGVLCVDGDGNGYCPLCGGKLEAG